MTAFAEAPHLIEFAAAALRDRANFPLDWANHAVVHRAVMDLFGQTLPGPVNRRREMAGILYRLDAAQSPTGDLVMRVLVQAAVAPVTLPTGAQTGVVRGQDWDIPGGSKVMFRVAVNPVQRTTVRFRDASKKVRAGHGERFPHTQRQAAVLGADLVADWLTPKLVGALSHVELTSHARDVTTSGQGLGKHRVTVDTIDGVATVNDSAALKRLRLAGVGRAKSYGCGLLSVRRRD
jgi:CRISPR system Cascade subunit CasE